MSEATDPGGTFTLQDVAAIITGGAVASFFFRDLNEEIVRLSPLGLALMLPPFALLGLTAAGPFVFAVRRFGKRPPDYPTADDRLWLALGLPWVVAACNRLLVGGREGTALPEGDAVLFVGLAAASALALRQLSRSWARLEPGSAGRPIPVAPLARTWTERVGRFLTLTWPVQLGLGFVVSN